MKSKLFSIVGVLTISSAFILSVAANPQARVSPKPTITVGTKVSLGCKNPGTHQDVAKTPIITNTTGKVIAAGKTVYWSATDGDKGNVKLQSQMAANGTVKGLGNAGNGYSCQAWMLQ